jgi:hypothetical protein
MALRYYLASLVDGAPLDVRWAPATIAVRLFNWSAVDGRVDDTVQAGRMLVTIDVTPAEHAQLVALAGVIYIPFEDAAGNPLTLDDPISALDPAKRAQIRATLESNHIDTDDLTLADPLREVVRRIIRRFRLRAVLRALDFTEGLDTLVSAIPAARRQNIVARLQQWGFDTSGIQLTDTIRAALRRLWVQRVSAMAVR